MRILATALCIAMAACAPLEPSDASVAPTPAAARSRAPTSAPAPTLVAYLGELRGMSEPTLAREIARQRQLLSKGANDATRTRLALALSLSPQGDDAEILARRFVERDAEFFRVASCSELPPSEALNHLFRFNGFHQFLYDFETLQSLLLGAGFSRVVRSSYRGSELAALNLDLDVPDRSIQSLYVEAIK